MPEFHAQTLPAGSAPKDRTFVPDAVENVVGDEVFPVGTEGMPGVTSADVYRGLGCPSTGGKLHRGGAHQLQAGGSRPERHGLAKHDAAQAQGESQGLGGADLREGVHVDEQGRHGDRGQRAAEDLPSTRA